MLRRPPTTLQLTQEDLIAYEASRAQRLARAAEARNDQYSQQAADKHQRAVATARRAEAQDQAYQQQLQTEEGDTEPDLSEDEDLADEEELDDSHLANRRPAAPLRHPSRQGHTRTYLSQPPPQFRMPSIPQPSRATASETAQGGEASDEEMQDLDTPFAASHTAAAASRDRRVKPGPSQGVDGTSETTGSRMPTGAAQIAPRPEISRIESREERERRHRARIMGSRAASSTAARQVAAGRSDARTLDRHQP